MTYAELLAAIRNYTEMDSTVFSDSTVDTFILLAESRILRDIDLDVFKKDSTTNFTSGARFLAAPADMLAQRYLMYTNAEGEQKMLELRDVSFLKEYWPDYTETGVPKYYGIWDNCTIYIAPTPDNSYDVQLGYIYRPAQLSSTNTTTWVSQNAPEALLYACLLQAYTYSKGPLELIQYYEQAYQQAIQGLGLEQQGRRRRDEYRDGMIRLPLKSETPGP